MTYNDIKRTQEQKRCRFRIGSSDLNYSHGVAENSNEK